MTNALFDRIDLHTHTYHSPCGHEEMVVSEILRVAEQEGIEVLAITDHFRSWNDVSMIDQVRSDVAKAAPAMKVLVACEADIVCVGEHSVTPKLREHTDFIMVAANHFAEPTVCQPPARDRKSVAEHIIRMFNYAVSLDFVDIIAHPIYVMPGTFDPLSLAEIAEADFAPAIEMAAKNNIAMEISRRALIPEQTPYLLPFYRMCKEAGLKFSVGSDAHRLMDVGQTRIIEPLINELGITEDDLWLPDF